MIGIYLIKNKLTNECYIGQSVNIYKRWDSHKQGMKTLKYSLYSDMRFYGIDCFDFSIIETCSKQDLDKKEMYWIKRYQELGYKLYNIKGVPEKEKAYVKNRKGKQYKKTAKKY